MRNTNRKNGNRFEKRLCEELFKQGYWVHNLAQNQAGQPFDVIAVKNLVAYAIDCKVCTDDVFDISRIEPNQQAAMDLWYDRNGISGWFALELSDGAIYMVEYEALKEVETRRKTLNQDHIKEIGWLLERWLVL